MTTNAVKAKRAALQSLLLLVLLVLDVVMVVIPAIAGDPNMRGRIGQASKLDVHHAVPEYVQQRMGLPPGVVDDCPGMLLHWDDHRICNANRPNSFHTILNGDIPQNRSRFDEVFGDGPGQVPLTREEAKSRLRQAYGDWIDMNGLADPETDHAALIGAAIDAWIDGVP